MDSFARSNDLEELTDTGRKKKKPKRVAVFDFETDPFLYGRKPEPFCWGFFDGVLYKDFWGSPSACVIALQQFLENYPEPLLLYAHNGGKFDFFYLVEAGMICNPIMIINGRLTKVGLANTKHELRDSYAIFPFALAQFDKGKIDYEKFEASEREKHRAEILHYLARDCESLYKLVKAWNDRFGPMLTVGGNSIKELGKDHPIRRGDVKHDTTFRPFYYGGRVEAITPGIHKGVTRSYDVNSMYPAVMKNFRHPYGQKYLTLDKPKLRSNGDVEGYPNRPYFITIEADNNGALPVRTESGLSFRQRRGTFLACSHEIKIALKHNLIKIRKLGRAYVPMELIRFDTFIDKFIKEKIDAKLAGDKIAELIAKYTVNASYGKFGQNPANYFDYHIRRYDDKKLKAEWELHMDYGEWEIWRKPAPKPRYFDVAIAASITSAARSVLLDALQNAENPRYCDTDSIKCTSLAGVEISDTALGAWKLEAETSEENGLFALAGKKMYALFEGDECLQMASKGADLDPLDIISLAEGNAVIWLKDAPTFKLGQSEPKFIDRVITATF